MNGLTPDLVYTPETIDFISGLPTGYTDNIKGRFTARLYIATAGDYTFDYFVDDRARFYFDGTSVFSNTDWGNHQFTHTLTEGWHDVQIDWY